MKNIFVSVLFFMWGMLSIVPAPVIAQSPRVPVIFSICTELPSADVVDFAAEINQYVSVADVSVVLSCGVMSPLLSSEQLLSMSLVRDGDASFLAVQPAAKTNGKDEIARETRQRELDWIETEKEFIEKTLADGKIKTLALLIDNMVLDYAGIRLSRNTVAITDNFAVKDDSFDEAAPTPTPTPMIRDNGNDADGNNTRTVEDSNAVRSVACNCDSTCEKRLTHLRMSLDELDAKSCAQRFPAADKNSNSRYTIVGAGGGVNLFTSGNYSAQVMVDVSIVRNRLGLVLRLGMEGDSSFEIKGRPFDTRAGFLELGPGWFADGSRIGFSLQPLLVLRYWEVTRSDISDAGRELFVDMGPGLHTVISFKMGNHMGLLFRAGIQLFPAARRIIVEDGPRNRIGLFHFPLNLGFFVRF